MKKNLFFCTVAFFLVALSAVQVTAQTVKALNPLTTFGPFSNGRIEPPSSDPLLETATNQRGMAADPVSGNLILVDAQVGSSGTIPDMKGNIFVLDGNTGATIGSLNTNGMGGGTYPATGVVIADDGAVYVCNQINNSSAAPFKIYRWSSVTSVDPPVIAFSGTMAPAQRYGASIAIRGAGTETQIIVGSKPQSSSGTNVAIFTTTDGTNFTANVLGTDVTIANFDDGIAFGLGNTFWAKKAGAPLRHMSFDLNTLTATTISSFDANALPASLNHGPLAVDNGNNLLATIDVMTGTSGSERVFLYDISDPSQPSLLDIKSYNPNFGNATAPAGYLDFNAGRLYSHVINNGLAAFSVDNIPTPAPTIVIQPPASRRLVSGQRLSLTTLGLPGVSYQWLKNGTNIPGATGASFIVPSAASSNGGTYRAAISNETDTVFTDDSVIEVVNLEDLFHLTPLWSAAPGSQPYINSTGGNGTPNQRTIAYNSASNQLYVVSRQNSSSANFIVYVVNATNGGAPLYTLKTNNISGGAIGLVAIAAADDGSIYACNVSSATLQWSLYRWANSDPNTIPTRVFGPAEPSGQGSNFRWGDVMDVRGTGTNTQIIIDNQNASPRYTVILTPTDPFLTNFTAKNYLAENTAGAAVIGRSLQFGPDNSYWQKRKGHPLVHSSFDPLSEPNDISFVTATYTGFSTSVGSVAIDFDKNILAAINYSGSTNSPDSVDLYEISELQNPLKLASYNFPQNEFNVNNFISQIFFADDYVFAINGNNGIMAFRVNSGPLQPPTISSQPNGLRLIVGGSGTMTVVTADNATYQWQKNETNILNATNASFTITDAELDSAGTYRVLLTGSGGTTISSNAIVTVFPVEDNYSLLPLWAPALDAEPYSTSTGGAGAPNERAIAYNANADELYVTHKVGPTTALYEPYVVDGTSGAVLRILNTNGIVHDGTATAGNNFVAINAIGVAGDGAIYAATLAPDACSCGSTNGHFRLYRWANSDSDTLPVQVFEGDAANLTSSYRWGDTLSVRGSGIDTEIIVDGNPGSFACVFKPTDGSMTQFTNQWFASQSDGAPPIGRSLQFGTGNSVWQKRSGKRLIHASYDLVNQTSAIIESHTAFPTSLGPVVLDLSRNLLAGIDFSGTVGSSPHSLNLYEISDFSTPMLIAKYNFSENARANNNLIGQVIISGNRVYAVNGNNGVMAFTIAPPSSSVLTLNHFVSGSNITFTWSDTNAVLQAAPNLNEPIDWLGISIPPQTNVVEDASSGTKFYRLKK